MTIGEKLQQLRKDNNYTQEELADIMGVSRQSISKWESDVAFPETEKLITLSKLYQCSIDYLLNEDSEEKVKSRGRSKYNTKKLPLIIMTLGFFLFTYFAYAFHLLFMGVGHEALAGTITAVLYFSFGFLAQAFAITYIFVEWKGLRIFIWISNILYLSVTVMIVTMCFTSEGLNSFVPCVLCGFSLVVSVLQFAVPAIRKTH